MIQKLIQGRVGAKVILKDLDSGEEDTIISLVLLKLTLRVKISDDLLLAVLFWVNPK